MFSDCTIWIPDDSADVALRLCIIAHTGPGGHRGQQATEQAVVVQVENSEGRRPTSLRPSFEFVNA